MWNRGFAFVGYIPTGMCTGREINGIKTAGDFFLQQIFNPIIYMKPHPHGKNPVDFSLKDFFG